MKDEKEEVVSMMSCKTILLVALIFFIPQGIAAQMDETASDEIVVFAAASLTGAFGEIGDIYENRTDMKVAINFDGSQALRTQIENGAYSDVVAFASTKHMNKLMGEGLMNNSSVCIFTKNKIALIVPRGNPAGINNLSDLARPGIKIVIGTKDVPVGDYALQIIDRLANDSAYGPDYKKNVMANIISQETTVSYVVTKAALGEADVGFAYVSDVTEDMASKVDRIEIPDEYNVIAEYPMGLSAECRNPGMAQEFMDLVRSADGRAVLERYGFSPAA